MSNLVKSKRIWLALIALVTAVGAALEAVREPVLTFLEAIFS